jgi:hypothetical protein
VPWWLVLKGKYSAEDGSTACSDCSRGYSSEGGSSSCDGQAEKDYFVYKGVATVCPKNSECGGATLMPKPNRGFWVDRRSLEFSNEIYKCPRETCDLQTTTNSSYPRLIRGVDETDNGSCWNMAAYSDGSINDDDDGSACNSDNLLCREGSSGALCSSCDENNIYSSAERVCVACDASQTHVLAIACAFVGAAIALGGLYFSGTFRRLPKWVLRSPVIQVLQQVLRQVDSGALRVVWANYQVYIFLSKLNALFHA